jgi:addiction module HigA family antidote
MNEFPVRRPKRAPTHPGAILRDDVLPALKMSVTETADRLHVSRQALHRILAEKAAVSPEMAIRLGRFCGNGPGLWLRMQVAHDLWHAERNMSDEVKSIRRVGEAA